MLNQELSYQFLRHEEDFARYMIVEKIQDNEPVVYLGTY